MAQDHAVSSNAKEEYLVSSEKLSEKAYMPFSDELKFEFSSALSQHIKNLPKNMRDILRDINKDINNIYKYEWEVEENPLDLDFLHYVIRVDLLIFTCGYYIEEKENGEVETKLPVLEIVQGTVKKIV